MGEGKDGTILFVMLSLSKHNPQIRKPVIRNPQNP